MTEPAPTYAVQHIRRMRGGSQAHLLRASDNHFYVTKFRNNPQHDRVLANEYLAGKLGAFLGLPMPEVRVIEVSEWLIQNTPELKVELAGMSVPCPSGLQLGSRYVVDPLSSTVFDYLPETILLKVSNLDDFARVLAFDKWTGNSDGRQAVFVRDPGVRRYRAIFIDQGYCFNAGEWDFPDSALRGVYARNSVYEHLTGWESFEPILSRIETLDPAEIWRIAHEIPPEWYQDDTRGLSQLIASLHKRREIVRDLIAAFRDSTRNPFPGWEAQQRRPPQPQIEEEIHKMTESTLKCAFTLDARAQTFKPAAHNLNPSHEQFNTDNAKFVDQTGRHRNPNPQKCQTCRKIAEELTGEHVASPAASGQAGPEAAAAQESESD